MGGRFGAEYAPAVQIVQPLRSVQSLAAVQSSMFQEFKEKQLDRNFQVSRTDGKPERYQAAIPGIGYN
jgi:hypothetical protein